MRYCLTLLALSQLHAAGVEFNRDVRPILSDKCYVCHGPDAAAKHIPFRLDSDEAAKADLGGGRRAIAFEFLQFDTPSPRHARRW